MQTRSTVSGWLGPNFTKPELGTLGWRIRRQESKEPGWYFVRELSLTTVIGIPLEFFFLILSDLRPVIGCFWVLIASSKNEVSKTFLVLPQTVFVRIRWDNGREGHAQTMKLQRKVLYFYFRDNIASKLRKSERSGLVLTAALISLTTNDPRF